MDTWSQHLEAVVWRAIATKAAHANLDFEIDLRVVCDYIRQVRRNIPTIVVPTEFPASYEPGFPAAFIRSPHCPTDTAYIIPAASELHDLLVGHGQS